MWRTFLDKVVCSQTCSGLTSSERGAWQVSKPSIDSLLSRSTENESTRMDFSHFIRKKMTNIYWFQLLHSFSVLYYLLINPTRTDTGHKGVRHVNCETLCRHHEWANNLNKAVYLKELIQPFFRAQMNRFYILNTSQTFSSRRAV